MLSEREALKTRYRSEYLLGAEAACCDYQGYPKGFECWPIDRRNAWWAGFNEGWALLHSKPGTMSDPSDRTAWKDYRRWEEGEIASGKLKSNELTGREDALTAPRAQFEAQLKDTMHGKARNR